MHREARNSRVAVSFALLSVFVRNSDDGQTVLRLTISLAFGRRTIQHRPRAAFGTRKSASRPQTKNAIGGLLIL